MAWWWWRRRRRPRWRRRRWRRRTRVRARRPRRPVRRRRRRVRRKKRGWRRLYRRWRRRGRRRRKRKRLIMTQWNPSTVTRCFIVGYLPIIITGQGTASQNYASHADDITYPGPLGGGISSMRFNLRILYDQYTRGLNFWTKTNEDLDLARYKGTRFRFYRHPDVDFIVTWETSAPFTDSVVSGPHQHPGIQMLMKKKVIIPSFKTKPKGSSSIKVTITPPKLMIDKWYPQTELCEVTLFTLHATACDLRFPFCSPQTDTSCIQFQVLSYTAYRQHISILPNETTMDTLKNFVQTNVFAHPEVLNTLATPFCFKFPSFPKIQGQDNQTGWPNNPDSGDGDTIYQQNQIVTTWMNNNTVWYTKDQRAITNIHSAYGVPDNHTLEHKTGIFSPALLSPQRLNPQVPGLYTMITYNPITDKGVGNRIWCDPLTKNTFDYDPVKSKFLIQDLQLWAAASGYVDYCTKASKDESFKYNYRLVMQSPYTVPALFHDTATTKDRGFIPIGTQFAYGRMPDGSVQIPARWRLRWYPMLANQQAVLEDLFQTGPFAYKGNLKSATLTCKYASKWLWGGNRVFQQVVRDPCSHQQEQAVGPSRKPRAVQVFDPKYQAPEWTFHAWDIRRGLFGRQAIKRVSAKPTDDELIPTGPKRPRMEVPAFEEGQEKSLLFRQRKHQPWEETTEEETEAPSETEEESSEEQQLLRRLQQQRELGRGLRCLFQQLTRTQMGLHVDPQLLAQV
nr:MAG: ORF1 [Torque teno virus]